MKPRALEYIPQCELLRQICHPFPGGEVVEVRYILDSSLSPLVLSWRAEAVGGARLYVGMLWTGMDDREL